MESAATRHIDVRNPATQALLARVPETTAAEFNAAVQAAKDAFPRWRAMRLHGRTDVMFRLRELILANMARRRPASRPAAALLSLLP